MDRKPKLEHVDGPPSHTASPADSPLPSTSSYRDFVLRASAPSSSTHTKYNVMKFAVTGGGGDRVIDPQDESQFLRPVKLNRKDPRTVRRLTDEDRERHNQRAIERAARAAGVKMEVDGDGAVKAEDGAAADGGEGDGAAAAQDDKEELDLSLVGKGAGGATNVQRRGPGGMFKKKTRRVFVSSEEARRLKREEWQPWVLEDDEGRERWIGRLEGGAGEIESSAKAPQQQNGNRAGLQGWRPAADSNATGSGGSAYVAFVLSDNQDEFRVLPVSRWYRFNQGPKYLTLAEEEAEEEYARQQKSKDPERWVMHRRIAPPPGSAAAGATASSSSGASTPRGAAASSSAPSASSLRSRMLANSAQGSRLDVANRAGGRPQEETKELEERIRREMRAVERPDEIPDDDEVDALEGEGERLNRTGKEIKKLVKKSDKTGNYESDDDVENPYASDDDDSDASATSHASGARPGSRAASPTRGSSTSRPASRAASPSSSGAAMLARRAASPSSKRKRDAGAGSDSEGGASSSTADGSKRRKGGSGSGKGKSPSPGPSSGLAPGALLSEADLIAFLKARPGQTSPTKDLLRHFGRALKDKRNKEAMGGLLKAVADFKEGSLVLKAGL
ncbi:uncharacterized protein RHOBADRAFT_51874 [Rhodotorula graminis WP1]|uniref:Transcription initiation factor IIF subunit alpha n=1 Tax=Rhodotorula graminis (strain WP1) TaxID=578459 RepID=A0A194S8J1_RHOGW|nr:uncharacterized protein RHOBADRAFT_51874 [Rhodotorula graminis WP1]KPV76889.1 hypothetical protein RHOBADRAFT_51874 [Rhodotorula graminis WP1]